MTFNDYINDIFQFFIENEINIKPFPVIKIDKTVVNRFDPFIKTGHYNSNSKEITLNVNNRHIKDILRTLCHELIHHYQNISENKFENVNLSGNLNQNSKLEEIEAEAYQMGNIIFRRWTEKFKENN